MPKTISIHNGRNWSRGHNVRDEKFIKNQTNIDRTLTPNNMTICDVPIKQAYEDIFGTAVEEYNARQKRSDRRIDDYYQKIKKDKRKSPAYECIVQIGNREDTGINDAAARQALISYATDWSRRNPNLKLIGAYLHCDEPDGTVHLHIDYIPVAHCTRGMSLQNSLDRALQEQGFTTENIHNTAQIKWQDREREALCGICRSLNIDVQRNQGIGEGREYLSPQEYKQAKAKQESLITKELEPLRAEIRSEEKRLSDLQGRVLNAKEVNALKGKKSLMGALKNVSYEEYLSLKKTALLVEQVAKNNEQLRQERDNAIAERDKAREERTHIFNRHNVAQISRVAQLERENGRLKNLLGYKSGVSLRDIERDMAVRHGRSLSEHEHSKGFSR